MKSNLRSENATDPRSSLGSDILEDAQTNGYPIVASQLARRDRAGLMFGGSIALLLGAATLYGMAGSRTAPAVAAAPPPPAPAVVSVVPPPLPAAVLPAPVPVVAPAPPVPVPIPPIVAPVQTVPALDRNRAPALIVDNGPTTGVGTAPAAGPAVAVAAKPAPQGLSAEEAFAQRLSGEDSASATRMTSPSTTVAQGTLMTAMLETAIDSDLSGYVRAVISRDVKSYDGSKILIPRSSRVIGQYQSGLAVGQTRAYVLWTRLLRPDGVSIALGSPATDFSGRNGLSGKVDTHFGKRFGSAILLSLIGASGQAIGGGGSSVVIAGPQQAAQATAQRDMNIPPTVRVNQGTPIRIFTARDLDFSTVTP
jgi:type IV secretion system protein VirB10